MNRTFQLLGLLLIGLLSFQAETVRAAPSTICTEDDDCTYCSDEECIYEICWYGISMSCDDE